MALDVVHAAETINALEIFIDQHRPPEDIRHQVDLSYKIENQSIIIHEILAHGMKKVVRVESPIAKATWVHAQKRWKLYWIRANFKMEPLRTST